MATEQGLPRLARTIVLPEELTNRDSRFGHCIRLVSDAFDYELPSAALLARDVRNLAQHLCPEYKPDRVDPLGILCNSGCAGKPTMGDTCCKSGCQLSQVIIKDGNYFYTGNIR